MQGLRLILLCAVICVQVKYSFSVSVYFKNCADNNDCPDDSACVTINTAKKCKCNAGFDAIDMPFTSAGLPVTVCKNLGSCSPFDNTETDCGANGECVTYQDEYGIVKSVCKCTSGYYGVNCDRTGPSTGIPPYTNSPPYRTTRRPGNLGAIIPAIGGGVLLLALLAGGAAALASSTG